MAQAGVILVKTPVLDMVWEKIIIQKQAVKSHFKSLSTNSNVMKETNPIETVSVEVPSKSWRTETKIVKKKQI